MRKKKILIFGNSSSVHIHKFCESLKDKFEIHIVSFSKYKIEGTHHYWIHLPFKSQIKPTGNPISKIQYFLSIGRLRKIVKIVRPHILHAHWASSYGIPASLSGFHPLVVSVWGKDVYDFPEKTIVHKYLFKLVLRNSDMIMSTSNIMKEKISKYTEKEIIVTPFGVDVNKFAPQTNKMSNPNLINIGIVKSLEEKYGIEYLLYSLKEILSQNPTYNIRLHIVGRGSLEKQLKTLSGKLSLSDYVVFHGFIEHENIPKILNKLDIAVFPSIDDSESFGVACVEAMACGIPVIVSDVDGFKEVTLNKITGLVIPQKNVLALVKALILLIENPNYRKILGYNGRLHVIEKYNWHENFRIVVSVYESLIKV